MMRSGWERRAARPGLAIGVISALVTLAGAGCGGSTAVSGALAPTAPPGTELPVIAGAAPGAPASISTVSPVRPFVPGAEPADSRAFCADVRQFQALGPALFQANGAAGALRRAQALATRFYVDAPQALRPAVQELAVTARRVSTDLGARPPNLADIARLLADPVYREALQRVVSYAATHC